MKWQDFLKYSGRTILIEEDTFMSVEELPYVIETFQTNKVLVLCSPVQYQDTMTQFDIFIDVINSPLFQAINS